MPFKNCRNILILSPNKCGWGTLQRKCSLIADCYSCIILSPNRSLSPPTYSYYAYSSALQHVTYLEVCVQIVRGKMHFWDIVTEFSFEHVLRGLSSVWWITMHVACEYERWCGCVWDDKYYIIIFYFHYFIIHCLIILTMRCGGGDVWADEYIIIPGNQQPGGRTIPKQRQQCSDETRNVCPEA